MCGLLIVESEGEIVREGLGLIVKRGKGGACR